MAKAHYFIYTTSPWRKWINEQRECLSTLKRCLDLLLILALSPIWVPVFLTACILIKLDSYDVIFVQKRVGLDGKVLTFISLEQCTRVLRLS